MESYQFSGPLSRSEGDKGEKRPQKAIGLSLGRSSYSYFIETGYAGWYYEKLELYSFWTKSVQEGRSLGSRKFENF